MTNLSRAGIAATLAVVALGGCSGGDDEPRGMYTAADVHRLAEIAPRTPGWPPWPPKPQPKQTSSDTPDEVAARDPIYAEYRRRTAGLESRDAWGDGNKWSDDDKLANLVVFVTDTGDDGHLAFLAGNDLSRGYGKKYGFVVKAEMVAGLGDEAWRLWTHGNGRQVTYHWRRGNLGFEVHIHCYGDCPDDDAEVDAAALAWATAIDEEARSARGLARPPHTGIVRLSMSLG